MTPTKKHYLHLSVSLSSSRYETLEQGRMMYMNLGKYLFWTSVIAVALKDRLDASSSVFLINHTKHPLVSAHFQFYRATLC